MKSEGRNPKPEGNPKPEIREWLVPMSSYSIGVAVDS